MKKLLAVLAVAIAIPTMSFAGGEGRYQIASAPNPKGSSSHHYVWVLDTETGVLRMCHQSLLNTSIINCYDTVDASK